MPKDYTRQGFHFHIPQGIALVHGKIAYLGLGKTDVLPDPVGNLPVAGLDFLISQPERLWIPAIEFFRIFTQSPISAAGDIIKNILDRLPHPGILVRDFISGSAGFQIPDH